MATYVPNAETVTEPVASREVGSAAEEFRALKTYLQAELDADADEIGRLQTQTLRVPGIETVSALPAATARASKLLGFDAGGSPQLYSADPELVTLWANVLAPGDGVADDTDRVQAALDSGPGVLVFSPGNYKFTGGLVVPSGVQLELDGATLDFSAMPAGTALGQRAAILLTGGIGSSVALSDVALGADVITPSSVAGFSVGDWIVVQSDELYSDGAAPGAQTRGHYAQIDEVGAYTLTLRSRSPFSYAAASNARVSKLALAESVRVRGGTLILGGVGSAHTGVKIIYAQSPRVQLVSILGAEDAGVVVAGCISPCVSLCEIRDSTSPGGSLGNTGYGVAVYGGCGGSISSNTMVNCRHGVAGGGYGGAVSSAVVVEGNTLLGCGINTWALDCHEPCFQWLFTGNTVDGGNGGAILRGPGTVFDGNVIRNVATSAVRVQQFANNVDGLLDVIVSNNGIANPGGGGVWVTGHTVTTDKVTAVIVTDNNIVGAGDHSIHGAYCVGLQVRGGSVREQGGSGRSGVYLANCTGAAVTGGRYDLSATANGTCVYIENSTGIRVSDATLLGASGATNQDGVRITGTTGVSVRGVVASGMSRHGVYATTSDRVIVAHNDVRDAGSVRKVLVEGATTVCVNDNIGGGSSLMRGGVMPEAFGADPSGVLDSSSAIQAAINAAGARNLSFFYGATYRITSAPVVSTSGLTIDGNGATLDGSSIAAATALDQIHGLLIEGSIGSAVSMTTDATAGAVALAVASTTSLVAGDLLLVYSTTEKFPEGATGATNFKGAIHRIRSVDSSTTLTLMDGLQFSLTAASGAAIRKVAPVSNVHVNGLRVVMGGLNKAHCGIRIKYATDCWLHDCETSNTEDTGVRFDHATGGGINGGKFSNCNSPSDGTSGVTGTTGYGVLVGTATRDVTVTAAVFRGCRHAVAGGGTYPSFGARVVGNTVYGGRSAAYAANYAFDCHEDCWGWTFERNSVHGDPRTGGFTIRGSFTVVAFNTIRNSGLAGILVQNLDTGGSYSRGNKILSNIIDTPASAGISVGGAVATPQYAVEVSGNDIQSPGATAGIYATGVDGLVITRNQIRHGAAANVNGIYLNGSAASAGNRCESVQVAENIITAPTGIGIRCAYTETLNLTSNEVAASASQAVNLLSCNGVAVVGGTLEVSAATASGVYIDGSNKVAVSGVTARQTATPTGSSAGVRMLNATADVAVSGGIYSGFATGVLSASPANYITVAGVNARNCTTSVNIAASANTAAAGNL